MVGARQHIGHGDKWKESALAPDEAYLATAEAVVRENTDSVKRSVFSSTEDADTVRFFSGLSNCRVRWTNVTRWASGTRWSTQENTVGFRVWGGTRRFSTAFSTGAGLRCVGGDAVFQLEPTG